MIDFNQYPDILNIFGFCFCGYPCFLRFNFAGIFFYWKLQYVTIGRAQSPEEYTEILLILLFRLELDLCYFVFYK